MNLTDPIYQDEDKARQHLEAVRWPSGPFCPHCGEAENVVKLEGKSHRKGLHKCYSCKGHFTVTVGTVFERSKIPLNKWVLAAHLIAASKKGYSAHQLHRTLEVAYKTAWFMMHRLREAMRQRPTNGMGGGGMPVEVDETFWGKEKKSVIRSGAHHKMKVLSLVERHGLVRSFHIPMVNSKTIKPILREHIRKDTHLMTDEHGVYRQLGKGFSAHSTVNHTALEYARGDVTTNHVEGYFSILKRGLIGTYHHVGERHLKRYVNEFDFRFNHRTSLGYSDTERATILLKGISGKRLQYY